MGVAAVTFAPNEAHPGKLGRNHVGAAVSRRVIHDERFPARHTLAGLDGTKTCPQQLPSVVANDDDREIAFDWGQGLGVRSRIWAPLPLGEGWGEGGPAPRLAPDPWPMALTKPPGHTRWIAEHFRHIADQAYQGDQRERSQDFPPRGVGLGS